MPSIGNTLSNGLSALSNAAGNAWSTSQNIASGMMNQAQHTAVNSAAQSGMEHVGNTISNGMDSSEEAARNATLQANEAQNRMAILSATMQVAALARSMMMQTLRDFVKDAKDVVKDQGEAGHKP